jgi:hypothetical protein
MDQPSEELPSCLSQQQASHEPERQPGLPVGFGSQLALLHPDGHSPNSRRLPIRTAAYGRKVVLLPLGIGVSNSSAGQDSGTFL